MTTVDMGGDSFNKIWLFMSAAMTDIERLHSSTVRRENLNETACNFFFNF